MTAQVFSIEPSKASKDGGRHSGTAELLATVGARYSRNNEGLDQIMALVDRSDIEKSIDRIFNQVDYGHASIADMTPVAIFLDNISLYLAYYMWSISPCASGQESSTRYIEIDTKHIVDPISLGVPTAMIADYTSHTKPLLQEYGEALDLWDRISVSHPQLVKIPEKVTKLSEVERLKRNFRFDRARVFLPLACKTNVMFLMSARNWAQLISHLDSHTLEEFKRAANLLREELKLEAPRMIRHSYAKESTTLMLAEDMSDMMELHRKHLWAANPREEGSLWSADPQVYCHIYENNRFGKSDVIRALKHRDNRYSAFGSPARMTPITWGINAVTFGDVRDLNRHRPGEKWMPLVPVGFYAAEDQLPDNHKKDLSSAAALGAAVSRVSGRLLQHHNWLSPYFAALGTQYHFEHTTTVNQFIYAAELRTGKGAHYRYAKHYHDLLQEFYKYYPESKALIKEGSAEPE